MKPKRRTLIGFLDHPRSQKPFDSAVECAWAHLDLAACGFGHVLHDGITVPIFTCQSEEDMEDRRRQWQQIFRVKQLRVHRVSIRYRCICYGYSDTIERICQGF